MKPLPSTWALALEENLRDPMLDSAAKVRILDHAFTTRVKPLVMLLRSELRSSCDEDLQDTIREVLCWECEGRGSLRSVTATNEPWTETCFRCGGSGVR